MVIFGIFVFVFLISACLLYSAPSKLSWGLSLHHLHPENHTWCPSTGWGWRPYDEWHTVEVSLPNTEKIQESPKVKLFLAFSLAGYSTGSCLNDQFLSYFKVKLFYSSYLLLPVSPAQLQKESALYHHWSVK